MGLFNTYTAGESAPASGVYAVLHSTPHKLIERVTYIEGETFQRCRVCPLGVLYRLEEPCVPSAGSLANKLRPGEVAA